MRKWIALCEEAQRPEVVYHGTSMEALIGIFQNGKIEHRPNIDRGHNGVSFTSELDVAKMATTHDWHDGSGVLYDEILQDDPPFSGGVILMAKTADLGRIEYYDDSDGDDLEAEWRTYGDVPLSAISQIAFRKSDFEQYLRDYLEAREEFDPSDYDNRSPDFQKGIEKYLFDPAVQRAIEDIIAYPAAPWPR
jgi:hypothetical protein